MYNVMKFQAPFERLKLYDECPYVNFFKAIVMQAIIDATNTSDKNNETKKDKIEARNWIFSEDESFKQYCELANFDHTYIRRLAKKVIKLHWQNTRKKNLKLGREERIINHLNKANE